MDGVVATYATCSGIAEVLQTKVPEPIGPVLVGVATGALTRRTISLSIFFHGYRWRRGNHSIWSRIVVVARVRVLESNGLVCVWD